MENKRRIGIYPGSFDPFTVGHLDILRRAAAMLDEVVIAVLVNASKKPFFTLEERLAFIERAVKEEGLKNVCTGYFSGLLVEYAQEVNACCIIRGLRAVTDFEYEFQMNAMNKRLASDVETLYLMADPSHVFLSSSIVKEVGGLGGDVATLLPAINRTTITERLAQHHAK